MRDSWRLGGFALATMLTGLATAAENGAPRYAYLASPAMDATAPGMARGPVEADRRCIVYASDRPVSPVGQSDALATQQPANRAVLDSGPGAADLATPVGVNVSASNARGGLCCAVATSQLVMVNVTSNALPASSVLSAASNTFGINVSSNTASLRATTATPVASPPVQ